MTDAEWAAIRPLLPTPSWLEGRGRQPEGYCHRQMLDAIRYLVAGGISWRAMPADFPEDGSPRRSPRICRHPRTAPRPSRSLSAPAGGISFGCSYSVDPAQRVSRARCWPFFSAWCRARCAAARPGAAARAALARRLEPVEKVSTHSINMGLSCLG
nr:transposase [Streptomyces sp. NBC_00830]